MNKKTLQVTTALLGLIPVVTGIIAMLGIDDPLYASLGLPRSTLLDSNLRFFAGLWLGAGIAMLWLVPSIERQKVLYRALWGATAFTATLTSMLGPVEAGRWPPRPPSR